MTYPGSLVHMQIDRGSEKQGGTGKRKRRIKDNRGEVLKLHLVLFLKDIFPGYRILGHQIFS